MGVVSICIDDPQKYNVVGVYNVSSMWCTSCIQTFTRKTYPSSIRIRRMMNDLAKTPLNCENSQKKDVRSSQLDIYLRRIVLSDSHQKRVSAKCWKHKIELDSNAASIDSDTCEFSQIYCTPIYSWRCTSKRNRKWKTKNGRQENQHLPTPISHLMHVRVPYIVYILNLPVGFVRLPIRIQQYVRRSAVRFNFDSDHVERTKKRFEMAFCVFILRIEFVWVCVCGLRQHWICGQFHGEFYLLPIKLIELRSTHRNVAWHYFSVYSYIQKKTMTLWTCYHYACTNCWCTGA